MAGLDDLEIAMLKLRNEAIRAEIRKQRKWIAECSSSARRMRRDAKQSRVACKDRIKIGGALWPFDFRISEGFRTSSEE